MEATSKWHKFLGLSKWSPEIVPIRLPKLWTAITPDCKVRSQQGLNQSFSPCRDLSNAMSHTQIGSREEVDSRLLVVGSQTVSLTPDPYFAHKMGCTFPMTPSCQALNIWESMRTPNPQLCKCWVSPSHLAKVGLRHLERLHNNKIKN